MKKQVKALKSTPSAKFSVDLDPEMLAIIKRTALNVGRPWRDVLNEAANQCFRKAWAGLESVQVQLRAEDPIIPLDLAVENMDQAVHAAQYFIAASHAYRTAYPNDTRDGEPWLGMLVSNALGEAVVDIKAASRRAGKGGAK